MAPSLYKMSPMKGKSWTPATPSGLKLWYDVSDAGNITVVSTNVTKLTDKSGNGNNATASSNYYTYSSGALNSKPGMTGNSGTSSMNLVSSIGTTPTTICVVAANSSTTEFSLFSPGGATSIIWPYIGYASSSGNHGGFEFWDGGSADHYQGATRPTINSGTPFLGCLIANASTISVQVDGTAAPSYAGSGTFNNSLLTSVNKLGGGNTYGTTNGTIGEIAVYNVALSSTDLAHWHTYAQNKWGTP